MPHKYILGKCTAINISLKLLENSNSLKYMGNIKVLAKNEKDLAIWNKQYKCTAKIWEWNSAL